MNQIHNTNNLTTATQNRMLPQTQSQIRRVIYATCFFMLTLIIIAEKYKIPYHQIVSSIIISSSIALIYLLTIYLQYGSWPEKQKRLKAYIDAFANALALLAIIVTFTSFVLYGEASALYTTMASSKSSDVFFGVMIGVLSSRVLFPFWDLHSKYKKI